MKIMPGYHSKIHIGYRRCYWLPLLLAVGRKMRNKKIFTAERSAKDSKGRDMQPSLFIRVVGGSSPEHSCLSKYLYISHQNNTPNSAVRQLKLRFPSGALSGTGMKGRAHTQIHQSPLGTLKGAVMKG